jgi:Tol biopolymer transport system component
LPRRISFVSCLLGLALGGTLVAGCGGSDTVGSELAFVSTQSGEYAIYAMNADGSGKHRLTDVEADPSTPEGLFFQTDPAWSPDGTQIAFTSARSGSFDVYVMRSDGSGTRRLTTSEEDDQHTSWSPDGTSIAFSRGTPGDIYVMNADGSNTRPLLVNPTGESEPAWSPDGKWIAYVQREPSSPVRELWLMQSDGTGSRRLTALDASSLNPAWAPDSKRLAFTSNVVASLYDIYVLRIGTKRARRVTREGPDTFEPTWSPDGSTIAFEQGGSIKTIGVDAGEIDEITDSANNDSSPAWNPRPPPAQE